VVLEQASPANVPVPGTTAVALAKAAAAPTSPADGTASAHTTIIAVRTDRRDRAARPVRTPRRQPPNL
jgi:hypothetical protein